MGLDRVAGQDQLSGDVRGGLPAGDQLGDLDLGGGQRVPAGGWPVAGPACTAADAEAAQAGGGPLDVPFRASHLINAQCLGEGRVGGAGIVPPGQQHCGVLECLRAVQGPAG